MQLEASTQEPPKRVNPIDCSVNAPFLAFHLFSILFVFLD
jgi:hypothetical protein